MLDGPAAPAAQPSAAVSDARGTRPSALWPTILLILALAAAWRVLLIAAMPTLSRDAVLFCWFARDLGQAGLEVLRSDAYDQHPLFPLAILAVQRGLQAAGCVDSPLLWQRAGQIVTLISGLALVAATAWLTHKLFLREDAAVRRKQAICAALIAALLPLNAWLSADVMSEQPFLLLCVLALSSMIGAAGSGRWLASGALCGLAYLTRPEAAVLVIAGCLAAGSTLQIPPLRRATNVVALLSAFAATAGPYVALIGGLSAKADKQQIHEFVAPAAAAAHPLAARAAAQRPVAPRFAALERVQTNWYESIGVALYQTLRSGRVVVPLLALPALWRRRRACWNVPLLAPVVCMTLHFVLAVLLQFRHGYLDPRHMLLIVVLMSPFAAATIVGLAAGRARWTARLVASACLLPLALYALRVPNGADRWVPEAVAALRRRDPAVSGKLLLGGASQRRVAFYCAARWQPWPEEEPDPQRRFEALRDHLLLHRPSHFLIEVGAGSEAPGNDALLEKLRADTRLRGVLSPTFEIVRTGGARVQGFACVWPS